MEKFDGTNWEGWAFSFKAALMFIDALRIAEGKEHAPTLSATPTGDEQKRREDWEKRSRQGLSLLLVSVKSSVHQSLDMTKSLEKNWTNLKLMYGTRTGLNLWVDYRQYTTMAFSLDAPLTQQIDEMSELRNRIVNAGLVISDPLHTLNVLQALPTTYEIVQQTILATITDFTKIDWANTRSRILSEELRQGSQSSVNAIRPGRRSNSCNWCGGGGHWERDCRKKQRGLSKEEAQSERKRIAANRKEEADAARRTTPSVSMAASETPSNTTASPPVTVASISMYNEPIIFYIARETKWMLDSGCSDHITHDISDFHEYRRLPTSRTICLADGNTHISYIGIGTVTATTQVKGVEKHIVLRDVIHSPELGGRFISIRKIGEKGISTTFIYGKATISKDGVDIAEGQTFGQQYWLNLRASKPSIHAAQTEVSTELLHARLGHLSWSTLQRINNQVKPIPKRTLSTCEGCLLGKSTRRTFKESHTRQTKPFALIHMDLAGPMRTRSIQGSFYYYVLVDDYTRFKWVLFIQTKDQALERFKTFVTFITTQFNTPIRAVRSDRGGEFISSEFSKFLEEKGIYHQLTAPHSPQQNGVAERANRTIAEAARSMLQGAGMTNGFWECAVSTAVHVRNCAPSRANDYVSPHERLFGNTPDLSYLRVFGCLAYRHITTMRTKLEPTSERLVFVGYEGSSKSYKLWNPRTHRFVISTDVTFEETIFPLRIEPPRPSQPVIVPSAPPEPREYAELEIPDSDDEEDTPEVQPHTSDPSQQDPQLIPGPLQSHCPPPQTLTPELRRSTRPNRGIRRADPFNTNPDRDRFQRGLRPWVPGIWNNSQEAFLAATNLTPTGDPTTYECAIRTPEADFWQRAMTKEIGSLEDNGTWELVDLPPGRSAIKNRWVYVAKPNTGGETKDHVRGNGKDYRARLVAKGFTQIAGIDYEETFAPVARLDSLRLLLSLAATYDWEIHQIDIKSAYLNGLLDEEIYMEQPKGFETPGKEDKVCRLRKAIYGLKQAGRQWHEHLQDSLCSFGFEKLISGDVSIFFKHDEEGQITIILVYVDDMAIFGLHKQVQATKEFIGSRYKYTDLGEIKHFLGLHITRDRSKRTLTIDQTQYIQRILARFEMTTCRPVHTPLDPNIILVANPKKESDSQLTSRYQQLIGSLMYAMLGTHPDICFAVNRLSQYGANPTHEHLLAAQHVLQYLSGTRCRKLVYGTNDSTELIGYSDSDWAGDRDDRRSTTGYTFILSGGAIAWATQKQRTIALSSTEAEYMALTETAKHAQWTVSLLQQLSFNLDLPIDVFTDSEGAQAIAANNVYHKRTKHIDIKYHYIREKILDGTVCVNEVGSKNNLADVFTKPIARDQHQMLTSRIGLVDNPIEGGC